jgi:trehalose 6-phosphate phosphatase
VTPSTDETRSAEADARWTEVRGRLDRTLVCLDFDGVLSPIVEDPARAHAHPGASEVLHEVARHVLAVAVVTGRPARQVLELGALEALADRLRDHDGARLEVRGQYGNERWSSTDREVVSPDPPEVLVALRERLPGLLADAGLGEAFVEEKGLAVAVHTRRLPDPDEAARTAERVLSPVTQELGLALEPGRRVVEVRAAGTDKGAAVRDLVEGLAPTAVVFVGDDLGDLPAFDAVAELRREGLAGLLVCSGSEEQTAVADRADLVVPGVEGVLAMLRRLVSPAGE